MRGGEERRGEERRGEEVVQVRGCRGRGRRRAGGERGRAHAFSSRGHRCYRRCAWDVAEVIAAEVMATRGALLHLPRPRPARNSLPLRLVPLRLLQSLRVGRGGLMRPN